jgi:(1->4)-alpha-D-glucan 1-alpha-D-glucosylmutase
MFYQALAGTWPLQLDIHDSDAVGELADRMAIFMLKAIREAKVRTSWTAPDHAYEQAVESFVRAALAPSSEFLGEFCRGQAQFEVVGALNSFAQTLIKLTSPGVPDIYQGAELWDLSLVDPDNRRLVDFDARRRLLEADASCRADDLLADWRSGSIKLSILLKVLGVRREAPSLFTEGTYTPLETSGTHAASVIAFLRSQGERGAVTIVPVRTLTLLGHSDVPLVEAAAWGDTSVALPRDGTDRNWRNVFTGEISSHQNDRLRLADVLGRFPVALLVA